MTNRFIPFLIFPLLLLGSTVQGERLKGTLVVAVPVTEGLVVCADKRLFNVDAGTLTDTAVKIRKIDKKALFVATNTVAFYDRKTRANAFDAFEITETFAKQNTFSDSPAFWNGLKKEINDRLRKYLNERKYAEWPESDKANNNLLFNLVFYSTAENRLWSHSLKVFYEKKRTPVFLIHDPVSEEVKTPKLSGKGREIINYLARNPAAASDPIFLRFDETRFDTQKTTSADAVEFAGKLFSLTSTAVPKAQVSPTFDCAILDRTTGFRWLQKEQMSVPPASAGGIISTVALRHPLTRPVPTCPCSRVISSAFGAGESPLAKRAAEGGTCSSFTTDIRACGTRDPSVPRT